MSEPVEEVLQEVIKEVRDLRTWKERRPTNPRSLYRGKKSGSDFTTAATELEHHGDYGHRTDTDQLQFNLNGNVRTFTYGAGYWALFMNLPGLRAFWPMGPLNASGESLDVSGNNLTAVPLNALLHMQGDRAPYWEVNVAGEHLIVSDSSALDITGAEHYINSGLRGLTIGGWFYTTSNSEGGLIAKWGQTNDERSYALLRNSSGYVQFAISGDGTNSSVRLVQTNFATQNNRWFWFAGRFTPSNEIKVYQDYDGYTNTTGIHASLHSSSEDLLLGGRDTLNVTTIRGRIGMSFVAAAALPDAVIARLRAATAVLYGA